MPEDITFREQELRDLSKSILTHFADKSVRWLFEDKENVRGLLEILASELVDLIDFNQLEFQNTTFLSSKLQEIELIDLVNQLSDEEEVEIMAKSMVDVTLERGIEQGKKEYAVEAILTVLEVKFQSDVADKLKPFLSAIDNLQRLDHLHRVAAQASDVDAFTQALLNLEN